MRKLLYLGIAGIILYEIAKVYFIMPMPGSQRMNSIEIAYFLHSWRWAFRIVFWLMIIAGCTTALSGNKKWVTLILLFVAGAVTYGTNYEMAADTMFYQPSQVILHNASQNKVKDERLVIGVEANGEAKAYPIQFIGYHHQVRDVLGGKPVIVTYCTVCRTGRVFEPIVEGKPDEFRLVGMDHFNAMFEDKNTGSWWRQANGEAIAGPLKGQMLPELPTTQTTVSQWFKLHPNSKIMQPDPTYQAKYDSMSRYESGKGKSTLTKTDTTAWKEKSWVVGVQAGKDSKAFDWNKLVKQRVINDRVGVTPVAVVIAADNKSFFAFQKPAGQEIAVRNDTLYAQNAAYNLLGKRVSGDGEDLKRVNAYQEFWHSWRTFHPHTQQY
ncbi:DUF3179 domain-containing (seleno)protein [Dyadobacter fanqingshengii]|uniref:DUF3179 domain-containing protein n=1 Tax=Dyadobacter fanqingshengii TaxID=2906443 RepID=A0A9X1PG31_9BACT|nr:DUF3179 domain-containing (seleno)protein [Dyadobacter fanqingshengii]MCF0043073.1 DUF3179 domain-containing protein [Dyadobacter fanqingshengii]USJ35626.1 DUF3179 domain-containing protein [Dyadobacter fanqingshengii]